MLEKDPQISAPNQVILDALDTVRDLLGMDVSYISEAHEDGVEFQHVSSDTPHAIVQPGERRNLNEMYCGYIAKGDLPPMITDTEDYPVVKGLRFTQDARIRSLISVPISRSDGSLYGMFCCFSQTPKPSLNQRDLKVVSMFARLASKSMNAFLDETEERRLAAEQVQQIIDTDQIDTLLQPIVLLHDCTPVAVEALSRFNGCLNGNPLKWFDLAAQANMAGELEIAAINKALVHLPDLPDGIYMTLNAGPATICDPRLLDILAHDLSGRVVLELTEHHIIEDLQQLTDALHRLRARGIRIAIDDLGAGYSGLSTVLGLSAQLLKLDRNLVSNIHNDTAKQSLAQAMVHFAKQTNATIVAEGIEKIEEHDTLRALGVTMGQGFLYARPTQAQTQIKQLHAGRIDAHTVPRAS